MDLHNCEKHAHYTVAAEGECPDKAPVRLA